MYSRVFDSRKKQFLYYAIMAVMIIGCATYMIFCQHYSLGGIEVFGIEFVYSELPIMVLAGLWGFIPAMISFSMVLVDSLFIDVSASYSVTVFLLSAILFYLFSARKVYRRTKLVLLANVVSIALLGAVWNVMEALATQQGLLSITSDVFIAYMISVIPETLVATFLLGLFFNLAPGKIKCAFYMGALYENDADNEDILLYQQQINSKLSKKLTRMIVVEAIVLGVSSVGFASQLLPSMADNMLGTTSGESSSEEMIYDWTAADSSQTMQSMITGVTDSGNVSESEIRFLMNNAGVAFIVKMLILIFNVSVPLIALADAFVQQNVARPIISMSRNVKNFATASRKEQEKKLRDMSKMNIKGNDEIAVLYDNMAEMAYEINSFVDQIVREQKLEEDLRVARIASENKSNFLNNVSHELRTPINAVLGLDEMILRESKEERIREYAEDIQNSGRTLLSLVNDILDSSKLEAGKMEILPVEYDVSSMINDIVNMISGRAKDKGLDLRLHIDANIPHILFGDEIRIKQVMVNILTNAVKYTEEGTVDFTLGFEKKDDSNISLFCSVKDTGIGIKEEDMPKLFSRFERIDEGKNRTIEGTGLGMNIVKQLLALMDSELLVKSVYGEGSEFSFEIAQKVVSWDAMGDYEEHYRRSIENLHYHESFTAPDAKVLVTDDTPMNLTVIKALLKATKVQIDTAESGFETLDKVQEKKYDIIFLDHRMPKMDGIETLKKMKELENNLNLDTPVISLTANAVSGARETYMAAGFVDYLSKPIDSKKLEHMLIDYLPKEKVNLEMGQTDDGDGEADYTDGDKETASTEGDALEDDVFKSLKEICVLDLDEAVKNCGSKDTFLEVLEDYVSSGEKKADEIEGDWQNFDYDNYTVLVHALKSSSRLVGAMELSEAAKELEALGNQAKESENAGVVDEQAVSEINEKTPKLLKDYRGLLADLSELFGKEDDLDKPEIDEASFKDGIATIREFAQAFDFDSADSVMKMLESYRIPEGYKEKFKEIKDALAAVDQQLLIDKIDEV